MHIGSNVSVTKQ